MIKLSWVRDLTLLKTGDCLTTIFLKSNGVTELNPFTQYVNENPFLTLFSIPLITFAGLILYRVQLWLKDNSTSKHKEIVLKMYDIGFRFLLYFHIGVLIWNSLGVVAVIFLMGI